MQLLSLSCVICISGEPRRYTQRASEGDRAKGGREKERETIGCCQEREREIEEQRDPKRGRKHTVMGEPI